MTFSWKDNSLWRNSHLAVGSFESCVFQCAGLFELCTDRKRLKVLQKRLGVSKYTDSNCAGTTVDLPQTRHPAAAGKRKNFHNWVESLEKGSNSAPCNRRRNRRDCDAREYKSWFSTVTPRQKWKKEKLRVCFCFSHPTDGNKWGLGNWEPPPCFYRTKMFFCSHFSCRGCELVTRVLGPLKQILNPRLSLEIIVLRVSLLGLQIYNRLPIVHFHINALFRFRGNCKESFLLFFSVFMGNSIRVIFLCLLECVFAVKLGMNEWKKAFKLSGFRFHFLNFNLKTKKSIDSGFHFHF